MQPGCVSPGPLDNNLIRQSRGELKRHPLNPLPVIKWQFDRKWPALRCSRLGLLRCRLAPAFGYPWAV
jgi:hypothetical protein